MIHSDEALFHVAYALIKKGWGAEKVSSVIKPQMMKHEEVIRLGANLSDAAKRAVKLLPALNNSEISRRVQLSHERVRQLRNKLGIENPMKHMRVCYAYPEEAVPEVVRLSKNRKITIKEIANKTNISAGSVRQIRKDFGLVRAGSANKDAIKRLFEAGKSIEEIATLFSRSIGTIKNIVGSPTGRRWVNRKTKDGNSLISPSLVRRLASLYYSDNQIAKLLGVKQNNILDCRRLHNITAGSKQKQEAKNG